MKTAYLSPLACLWLLSALPAAAQQPAMSPVRTTTTAVSRMVLFKLAPGQGAAYNQDVMDHLMPIYEEEKKAGILTEYRFFSKTTTESPEDWNVGVMLTYANFAALDNLTTRTDPITLKHYGSTEKRTAAGMARGQLRTVVSSFLTQTLSYSR
ncbi:MAG TPA: hypothetical protein VGQ73_08715 [Gemmatimonadales bacterium]|jgi:hypothetical protein|nr:hypothetical protein [Gemmatimonadales bacterium]